MSYEFTMEDFAKFTQDLIDAAGDQAVMSTLLADMQATISDAMGVSVTLTENNNKMKEENERLKTANMDLMYRLGQKAIEENANNSEKEKSLERGQNVDSYLEKLYEED